MLKRLGHNKTCQMAPGLLADRSGWLARKSNS